MQEPRAANRGVDAASRVAQRGRRDNKGPAGNPQCGTEAFDGKVGLHGRQDQGGKGKAYADARKNGENDGNERGTEDRIRDATQIIYGPARKVPRAGKCPARREQFENGM